MRKNIDQENALTHNLNKREKRVSLYFAFFISFNREQFCLQFMMHKFSMTFHINCIRLLVWHLRHVQSVQAGKAGTSVTFETSMRAAGEPCTISRSTVADRYKFSGRANINKRLLLGCVYLCRPISVSFLVQKRTAKRYISTYLSVFFALFSDWDELLLCNNNEKKLFFHYCTKKRPRLRHIGKQIMFCTIDYQIQNLQILPPGW